MKDLSNSLQSDDSAVVLYDKKDGKIDYTSVTFGKGQNAAAVALHNVADGQIAEKSHDVVTGGQIHTISQDVAQFLGGDTAFKEGSFTGPTYQLSQVNAHGQVETTEFKDVGSAFTGLDTNIKNVNQRIKEVSEGVAQDSLSWSKEESAFSALHGEGRKRTASKITHILDGNIASGSTDAVTGGQLYSMNNTLANYFGGGAEYKEGKWIAPNFKVNTVNAAGDNLEEKSYDDVAQAFAGVGTSFTNLHNKVTNAVTDINNHINNVVSDSLVKQDADSKVIKIGAEKGGTSINIANSGDAERTLTGVKAGALTEISTDAVNGSQLYSMNNTLASYFGGGAEYKEGKWVSPSFKVNTVSADGDKVEEQSYKTVAEAFAGVGSSFTNIHKELKNEINQVVGDSLVKQDEKTRVIAVGGEKSGTKVTFVNTDGAARTLTGVKAGELAEASTEAVNGSQLFTTNQNVTTVTNNLKTVSDNTSKYLGGGADVFKGVAPTYTVQDKSYQSVADAFTGVDHSFTKLHEEITENTNEISENIKQNALLWSDNDHAFVATHGTDGDKKNSKITLLANGEVSVNSSDAVTGSQLYALGSNVAQSLGGDAGYENGIWKAPSFKFKTVNEDGSKVEEQSYDDVAQAFAGVGSSFENLYKEFTQNNTEVTENIKQNALLWSDSEKAFVATHRKGDEKGNSKIKFLSNGEVSASSSEAVNGSQLFDTNKTVASYLGGGAEYKEGHWSAPSFKVKIVKEDGSAVEEQSYDDVAKAFAGVGNSFTNIHKELKNEINQVVGDSLVKQDEKTHAISVGGEKSGTEVKLSNIDGAARTLSGVKSGTLSEASSEAVNGSQLFDTNKTVASYLGGGAEYKEGQWSAPSFKVKIVKEDGSAVEEQSYDDVAKAFAGVGNSFTNIHKELQNEINKVVGNSLVKQDDATKVIKIGDEKEGSAITISNMNGDTRSLSGVKAGTLSEGSTEAVNGSQLYSLNQTLAMYLGGGASYEGGEWSAPSFKVKIVKEDGSAVEEQSYDDVASAFAGVGDSFTNIHKELQNEINKVVGDSLVKQDDATKVIKIGGEKEGSAITIANMNGDTRSLSGVKAGTLSEGSTEAVNGSQLYSLHQTLAMYLGGGASYEGGEWRAPEFKVAQFNSDGSSSEKQIYHDVAGAFDGVSDGMTSINERIHDVEKNVASNGLNWNEKEGAYDAKHDGKSSKITNVLDGKIEEGSQEVVNGGQLWSTNERVKEVEDKVDTIDQHVKDIEVAVTDGVVNYDKDSDGKKTNSITLVGGNDSEPVMIDNVAAGKIETGSQQAVNGGQLHDYTEEQMKIVLEDANKYTDEKVSGLVNDGVNESKSYTDMKFETLNYAIQDVRKEARQAAAIGLAVSNLRYYDIPGSLSVSFGSGLWRSQSALAIGAGYTSEDGNIRSNVSVTSAGGHWGIGAGITLRLR